METHREEIEVLPFAIPMNVTDLSNNSNEILVAATGIAVDASTTENTTLVSSENTIMPHQLHDTQLLPPKLQDIINNELEPNERILYNNDLSFPPLQMLLETATIKIKMLFFVNCIVSMVSMYMMFMGLTADDKSLIIPYFFYMSPAFLLSIFSFTFSTIHVYCRHDYTCNKAYVITDHRVITLEGLYYIFPFHTILKSLGGSSKSIGGNVKLWSMDPKDFTEIIVRPRSVTIFQQLITDPSGNQVINELYLLLRQDGNEIVAMLKNLKEKGSSQNSTLEGTQPQSSINLDQMCSVVPPHIEEIINRELQAEERVVKTMCNFHSYGRAISLAFGIYLLLIAVGVSFIPSKYFIIPTVLGILVILLTIRQYRNYPVTVYVITDRRAMRISSNTWISCKSPSVYAFPPFQAGQVFRRTYPNGTGDVIFAHKWVYSKVMHTDLLEEDGFFGVPNAKDIEKKLKELARRTGTRG